MSIADEIAAFGAEVTEATGRLAFHTGDDIPRVPHDPQWVPEFTPASVEARVAELRALRERWLAIDVSGAEVWVQVDYRLLGSMIHRALWDLEVTRNWEHNAVFLVGQILGPWYDLLLPLPPFAPERQRALVDIMRGMPDRVALAQQNIARAGTTDLALSAAEMLEGIDGRLVAALDALGEHLDPAAHAELAEAVPATAGALEAFRARLLADAPSMAAVEPVGRERFVWFLRNVALIPDEPEDLVRAAEHDLHRAVVAERLTRNRYRDVPPAPLAASLEAQLELQHRQEAEVREFLETEGLLTQPESLRRYHVAGMPRYVEALRMFGVPDDLTDEHRLDQDGVSYTPAPEEGLAYFYAANARDPRLGIIHEGAHYKQLALSWANPDAIRRRYIDSSANEGIAHYTEELTLLAGLFDDAPHSQTVVHNFMRLRALRVIADVNLATGVFTLEQAVDHFVRRVPMDHRTAAEESAMYLATPGLAMSYHVGKQQLLALVSDAIVERGDDFSFRELHDAVFRNGNVPFALLRWELLGDRSALDALDADQTPEPWPAA
ncbi:DUF885 family protein [Homoserinibacter sp. GY 40078]|uniref:DUF885 family protein n=1 Tax=Homoserinibacter sp. GY 40078 TaxID=2603275 RepID=UPI00164FC6A9|nr:DUF885 family protein [Homoserinibacter sp. GY 40078]